VPRGLQLVALVILGGACAGNLWALHVNRFLSPVVRVQSERGHRVVTEGPYAWVRHPYYLSAVIILLVNGAALGSFAATPVAWLYLPVILARTITEDRFLKRNLTGYRDYAHRVHSRLIPGIW
jgi:protein-S-isoprenylcysteine O-methyltransferase Ste14